MQRGQRIEVEWYDAADEADGWMDAQEALDNASTHPVSTIGYFLGVKNEHLYLTPTIKGDDIAVLSIVPMGCIFNITKLDNGDEVDKDSIVSKPLIP